MVAKHYSIYNNQSFSNRSCSSAFKTNPRLQAAICREQIQELKNIVAGDQSNPALKLLNEFLGQPNYWLNIPRAIEVKIEYVRQLYQYLVSQQSLSPDDQLAHESRNNFRP